MQKILKKILIILLFSSLITGFFPPAYAEEAKILSDEELDEISAGGFDANIIGILVKSAAAYRSAVATQCPMVGNWANQPEPTIAQSNIAAAVAAHGSIDGATVTNRNSLDAANSSDISLLQDNIAVVAALSGSICNATIENSNNATVEDWQDSVAYQRNIAVAIADGGTIDNATSINNMNFANIDIETIHCDYSEVYGVLGNIKFDCFVSQSASVLQINIAVIATFNNGISNASVTNSNIANVYHFP